MNIIRKSTFGPRMLGLIALAAAFSLRMQAAAAGNLPWEKPMAAIATSLTQVRHDTCNFSLFCNLRTEQVP